MNPLNELAELVRNLGTPLIDETVMKYIDGVVVLRRSFQQWTVSFVNGVLVEEFVFNTPEEAKVTFSFLPNVVELGNVVIFSKSPLPHEVLDVYKVSERFSELSNIESRLTKFSYQISGIGAILSSLTEPLPTELILPLFAETISELFLTPVGVYKTLQNKSTLIYYAGEKVFDLELSPLKLKGVIFGSFQDHEFQGFEFHGCDNSLFHVVLSRKDIELEEKSILSALGLVFQKGRELMETSETFTRSEKLISLYEFALRALSEFSVHVLSSRDFDELKRNIVDYLAEIYQAKYAVLYEGKETLVLKAQKNLELINLPSVIKSEELNNVLPSLIDFYTIDVLDQRIVIAVGEELIPGYIEDSVKRLLKEIVSTELLRAVENVIYQHQLIKEKATLEFYNTVLSFIMENYIAFQEMPPEEILRIFESYSSSFLPFVIKGASLFGELTFGVTDGVPNAAEIEVRNVTNLYGSVFYESKRSLTEEEERVLLLCSIVVLTAIEHSILTAKDSFGPDELLTIAKFRYLRKFSEKPAILEGEHEDAMITVRLDGKTWSLLPEYFAL